MSERLTKFNEETGEYEYRERAKTQEEFNAQRKAVIQRLGELENRAEGEWRENLHIGYCGYNGSSYECSNCHKEVYDLEDMNFCPNCGAKMDGKRREQNEG